MSHLKQRHFNFSQTRFQIFSLFLGRFQVPFLSPPCSIFANFAFFAQIHHPIIHIFYNVLSMCDILSFSRQTGWYLALRVVIITLTSIFNSSFIENSVNSCSDIFPRLNPLAISYINSTCMCLLVRPQKYLTIFSNFRKICERDSSSF